MTIQPHSFFFQSFDEKPKNDAMSHPSSEPPASASPLHNATVPPNTVSLPTQVSTAACATTQPSSVAVSASPSTNTGYDNAQTVNGNAMENTTPSHTNNASSTDKTTIDDINSLVTTSEATLSSNLSDLQNFETFTLDSKPQKKKVTKANFFSHSGQLTQPASTHESDVDPLNALDPLWNMH